ncbi:phage major capsid protein [Mesorhizobium sp. M1B.F.Ca.ET.045.04.1.1]|uniref:phage major capsid protein n=1 Tax=Mesorhizobium sp. M1B.F.Ca.ET.045.04.1.1 TaxID=2493673 RepID=UPI000F750CAA|nr:phage major capsid protein [Mesorhizobium sp. M1B.F.Ca.ET.045.04.1.1]AZO29418.1 phage major capsid protein [Mesorhizobium sp. M1B.F.Ca.ET.045.04.1.1]
MLAQLKARLKELSGEIKALTDKTDMSAEDFTALETKTTELEDIEKKIDTLTKAEEARARAALPANDPAGSTERAPATVATKLTTVEKVGLMIAGMARAWIEEKAGGPKAVFRHLEAAGYGDVAKEFDLAQRTRALNSGSAAAGGVLVPEAMSSEIIDVLRPMTTFLQGGPRRVPLVNGSYKMPKAASGATAGWRGEGQAIAKSQPTFKEINMVAKYVDALVPITNQLIRYSLPDVRGWVEMDMANVMGVEIDRAAYLGEGTAYTPLGITKISGVTVVTLTATGTSPTIAQIEADASSAELGMMNANLPMLGAKWVMSPRTFIFLQNQRDGNGNRYYPELQNANPTWRNKPVLVTTQNPVNGGAGTDETEIWLVAFGHVLFGEGMGISFSVSTEATVVTNGTAVSAFQNDLTYIKASTEADFDMRYLEAVSVIPGVRWGA